MSEVNSHFRNCNICEAMCGIEVQYKAESKEIISIKGDKNDPFSKGHMCPKALALQDFYEDKDRLKQPIKRTADGWQEISWQQAFDEIGEKVRTIQNAYGKNALGIYLGNPNAHNFGNSLAIKPFSKVLGTLNRYSSASTDQMPHHVASNYILGNGMLVPVPDIDRTDFMLIIGANPVVSNGSMMTAPGVLTRLTAIQKRGGKVVVVDPQRTKTAKMADQHLFIRPEKDALLLLSLIHCIFANNQVRLGHLSDYVNDLADIEQIAKDYAPELVAAHIGIGVDDIKNLATEMSAAESAVCYSRMGASTQSFGGLCQWLTIVLNVITGNFDREGGAMFPLPAFNLLRGKTAGHPTNFGKYQSRVKNMPFFNGEFPTATLADEILTEGDGQIKAMITIAGNPVLSAPDGQKVAHAFQSLEFMVAVDIYLNETTKHADIILPATTGLENAHYDVLFHSLAVRNTAKYSAPLFEKSEHQLADWEILNGVAKAVTGKPALPYSPETILDMELKAGPYGLNSKEESGTSTSTESDTISENETPLSLEKLKANPHGIDLGPLSPSLPERLLTASGKIELAPSLFINDLPRLNKLLQSPAINPQYPFELISRRLVKSHNTWTQNSARLVKGKNPVTLDINPQDADKLGISQGQLVVVSSPVGEVILPASITDDVLSGVVSMPQGWGHNQADTQMTIAATQAGVSINDVTAADRVDVLTGNAAFNGTPVAIRAA